MAEKDIWLNEWKALKFKNYAETDLSMSVCDSACGSSIVAEYKLSERWGGW